MTTVNLTALKPPELISEIVRFLSFRDQCQFMLTCRQVHKRVLTHLEHTCTQKYPELFALLREKQWTIPSWTRIASYLQCSKIAVSHEPSVMFFHADRNGPRKASLTHETRDWLVNQVWQAGKAETVAKEDQEVHPRILIELSNEGMTGFIFNEMMDLHQKNGQLRACKTLAATEWKSVHFQIAAPGD